MIFVLGGNDAHGLTDIAYLLFSEDILVLDERPELAAGHIVRGQNAGNSGDRQRCGKIIGERFERAR